jgi:Tfp pilus assembly protein PilF
MMKIILLLTLMINIGVVAQDEQDLLALASFLLKSNNFTKAYSVLKKIKDPQDVQTDRYYLLLGVTAVKQKRFKEAISTLLKAQKSGLEENDLVEFNETLLRAYIGHRDFDKALALVKNKEQLLKKRPLFYQLKATLEFDLDDHEKAWSTLHRGLVLFPKFFPLKKQKWFYLFNHELLWQSKEYLFSIIGDAPFTPLELAQIAFQYKTKKDLKTAAILGEMAFKKAPSHEEIAKELARIYLALDQPLAAAEVFSGLAHFKPNYLAEASELWRKAGYPNKASRLAALIPQEQKRLKQKLTIALQNKSYQEMTGLGVLINRSALKENEDVQYSLAYAHFMLGEFKKSESYLQRITNADLLKKSLSLRETIQECQSNERLCL